MTAPLVVILAGGEGRRIGGDKPLRKLAGERLIDRAVRLGQLWSDDLRIALREPGQAAGVGVSLLIDDPAIPGPLAGLKSALQAARNARRGFALTIPCDVPFLPSDLGARLQQAIGSRPAALAATGPDLHPTCALWRTEALERLPLYLKSGRRSLLGFAEVTGFARAEWAADRFFNVNSAMELAEAEGRLASEV